VIVVTAGTSEYRDIILAQRRACDKMGYAHYRYDLGGLGFGIPYAVELEDLKPTVNGDSLPPATFKAALVAECLRLAEPNELVCWMDADCLPVKDFNIPSSFGGFDVAVTLRPEPEIGLSNNPALDYLNSGVVWIRNTPKGLETCELWHDLSLILRTDQGALNLVTGSGWGKSDWKNSVGATWDAPNGSRFLVLPCMEWNSWHFGSLSKYVRILHFKAGVRHLAKDYIR
jgi:hypothetical protein